MIVSSYFTPPSLIVPQGVFDKPALSLSQSASFANTDTVTLSQAAMDMLAQSSSAPEETPDNEQSSWLVEDAREDPVLGAQLAHDFTYIGDLIALQPMNEEEISRGIYIPRYYATGLPVTAEGEAYFKRMADETLQGRIAIYQSEIAKGASPAEILEKIVSYMDSQPEQYKQMTNWDERAWG